MANEIEHLKTQVNAKDSEIEFSNDSLKETQIEVANSKGGKSEEMHLKSLEGISELEAQLKFKDSEIVELGQELVGLRSQKNRQIDELKEKLDEYKDLYDQARQSAIEL